MAKPLTWARRAGRRSMFLTLRSLGGMCGFRHAPMLGKLFGEIEYRLAWRRRRRCVRDMAIAFGRPADDPWVTRQLRLAHQTYAQGVFEVVAMFDHRHDQRVLASRLAVEGTEHLHSALAAGHGAILLGTHAGNGVLLAVLLALQGWPVSVVYRKARMMSAEFFEHGLALYGVEPILANEGLRAYSRMRDAARRGRIVFVTLDQGVRRASSGIVVRFLGKDMAVAAGPAQLARRASVPVLPVTTTRHGAAWRFHIEPPLPLPSGSLASDVEQMARAAERQVSRHPELWGWAHRRWHKLPFARATMPDWKEGEEACDTSMHRP